MDVTGTPAPFGSRQRNGKATLVCPYGPEASERMKNHCESMTLNPKAREWEPRIDRAPEEDRCLFLTFSNGYPLCQRQISEFFTGMYGPCVEKVYVQKSDHKDKPPLFGKVVFDRSVIPAVVMGGETQVKFIVDKRPLWCKRFHPKDVYNINRQYKYLF